MGEVDDDDFMSSPPDLAYCCVINSDVFNKLEALITIPLFIIK
jgi:hypothetical protein